MKLTKIIMLCAVVTMVALSASVSAQTRRDEKAVPEDQIPIAIRNAFQQDFASANDTKGYWYIYFEQQDVNNRIVATPLEYIYRRKQEGKRIEVRYNAAGKLEKAKGITRKESGAVTAGTN